MGAAIAKPLFYYYREEWPSSPNKTLILRVRNCFILFILAMLALGLAFMAVTYALDEWRFSYDNVKITEFTLCQGLDPLTGKPRPYDQQLTARMTKVGFCGYLTTDIPVELRFYLYRDGNQHPVDWNQVGETISPGYFYEELDLQTPQRSGRYTVRVYLFRNILAETTFDVALQ
jgi:hypothetical protein